MGWRLMASVRLPWCIILYYMAYLPRLNPLRIYLPMCDVIKTAARTSSLFIKLKKPAFGGLPHLFPGPHYLIFMALKSHTESAVHPPTFLQQPLVNSNGSTSNVFRHFKLFGMIEMSI